MTEGKFALPTENSNSRIKAQSQQVQGSNNILLDHILLAYKKVKGNTEGQFHILNMSTGFNSILL